MNLKQYREDGTSSWIDEEVKRLGSIHALLDMQKNIYKCLLNIRPGQFFVVEKNVRPENLQVFVKTACEFIWCYPDYRFSNDYSKIIRNEMV